MDFNNLTPNDLAELYRDYVNNFLSIGGFACHYGIAYIQALTIIDYGRQFHERHCDFAKEFANITLKK